MYRDFILIMNLQSIAQNSYQLTLITYINPLTLILPCGLTSLSPCTSCFPFVSGWLLIWFPLLLLSVLSLVLPPNVLLFSYWPVSFSKPISVSHSIKEYSAHPYYLPTSSTSCALSLKNIKKSNNNKIPKTKILKIQMDKLKNKENQLEKNY